MPKFTRKKNRLPYPEIFRSNTSFFISICVWERKCIFAEEGLSLQNNLHQKQNGNNGDIKSPLQNFNYHKIWQKSFYDHIIRSEDDFQIIREYIYNNPLKWELDLLNPKNNDKYQIWIQRNQKKIRN